MFNRRQTKERIELSRINTEILSAIAENQQEQTRILRKIATGDSTPSNVIPFPSFKEIPNRGA